MQDGCGRECRQPCVATRRLFEFGALRSSCGTTKCQQPTHSFQRQVSSFPRFCAALPCLCPYVACGPTAAVLRASVSGCPAVPKQVLSFLRKACDNGTLPGWKDAAVQGMAAKLVDDLRRDKVELVAKSHSTISVESCAQLLGMSREEAVARCQSLGWAIEGDFIKPVKSRAVMPQLLNSDELQALTGARRPGLPVPCAFAAATVLHGCGWPCSGCTSPRHTIWGPLCRCSASAFLLHCVRVRWRRDEVPACKPWRCCCLCLGEPDCLCPAEYVCSLDTK